VTLAGLELIVDSIWRPRRDLNPCYRRERASMARNFLKTEDTDGPQWTSEDISEMIVGRQLDAFSGQSGRTRRPLFNDLERVG